MRLGTIGLGGGLAILLGAGLFGAGCSAADSSTLSSGSGAGDSSGVAQGGGDVGGASNTSGSSQGGGASGCGDGPDCPGDQVCADGMCVDKCGDAETCAGGLTCCGGGCVDIATDMANCGSCGSSCPQPVNQVSSCDMGVCTVGGCLDGFFDCDGMSATGCESDKQCQCTPGGTQPCYPGPPGTSGKGVCKDGTQTCNATGTAWSLCNDFVVPTKEVCNNNIDEDCTDVADDVPDIDGDGWTACDNDCCEIVGPDCADPKLVNPGAFEFVGNMIDDDCDPATSDAMAPAACSTQANFNGVTPQQMVEAIDLCQTASANDPLPTRKWGVLSAQFRLANGNQPSATQLSNMQNLQAAVLVDYGSGGVIPQVGPTMAGISSGRMRDQNDANYVNPNGGSNLGSSSQPPAKYLNAHGGNLPASLGCNGSCPSGIGANDSVNLRMEIRVPTNALSFAYRFRFFSSEYWTWSCTVFNDFFLAMLTSGAPNLPADGNISFDSKGNPLSVNNGFFEVCVPKQCYTCPDGTTALQGTGMQLANTGGGTKWLQTTAPVVPGETITFELMVFDVSDGILDSLSLLDAFEWSITASGVGTGPPG